MFALFSDIVWCLPDWQNGWNLNKVCWNTIMLIFYKLSIQRIHSMSVDVSRLPEQQWTIIFWSVSLSFTNPVRCDRALSSGSAHMYNKTFLTDPLHISTAPLYRPLYLGPKRSLIQYYCNDFYIFLKLTTSLNGPFKIGPMVSRFREVICTYAHIRPYSPQMYEVYKDLCG